MTQLLKNFIILFFFANSLISAQQFKDTVYVLTPVVVEAVRTERPLLKIPYSVSIINMNEINSAETGRSIGDVMSTVPGLVISDRNNPSLGEKISIRGVGSRASFGVRGIKILVDDIPLTMPDGQSQINNIDLHSTGEIELLRGPSSTLYGNAAGGVINFKTETPFRGINFNSQYINGSYGLQRYNIKLSANDGYTSFLVSLNKTNYKGFREHAAMSSSGINALLINKLSSSLEMKAVLNLFDSPYLLNPSSLTKIDVINAPTSARSFIKNQGAGEKTQQLQSGITLSYREGDSNFENTIYFITRSLYNPIPGRVIDLKRNAGGLRSIYNYSIKLSGVEINAAAGTDVELQFDRRTESVNTGVPEEAIINHPEDVIKSVVRGDVLLNQDERVVGLGPFVSLEFSSGDFILNTGLRYDRYTFSADDKHMRQGIDLSGRRIMDQFSPSAGIVYRTSSFSSLFINYATSFQTPSTNELGNRPDIEGGFNPFLKPERLFSYEAGYRNFLINLKTELSLSLFIMNFNDMLIPYQLSGGGDEVFYRNAGKALNRGVELSASFYPMNDFTINTAYTFMDFRFKDYIIQTGNGFNQLEGNKIPGIPSGQLFAGLFYQHRSGIFAEIKFRYTGEYFTNDLNGPPAGSGSPDDYFINDSYTRTDIRLGFQHSSHHINAGLFIGLNNIFDKKYTGSIVPNAAAERYFEPAPGRNWYAGMRIDL